MPEGNTGVTLQQRIALGKEIRTSIRLIQAGLGQLQRISGANDFYHLPMLTLASGFERLMKSIICLHCFREIGKFPKRSMFPSGVRGHDLFWLLNKITNECFDREYIEGRRAASDDIGYLRDDAQLHELIKVLSDFGQSARYHDLNIVLDEHVTTSSPQHQWDKLEGLMLKEDEDWAHQWIATDLNELHEKIGTRLISRLERFARALCRLFTIGGLGPEAAQYTGIIAPFLFLSDDKLGTRSY